VQISFLLFGLAMTGGAHAGSVETGGLTCSRIAGKGYNLLITSKAHMRCTFVGSGDAEQWYLGETGVALGVDLKWNKEQTIYFGVLSQTTDFQPEGDFLTGKYGGAKAEASLGVGLGAQILIGGSEYTAGLKPAVETSQGVGAAAGLSYLNLKPDPLNQARLITPRGRTFSQALYSAYFQRALNGYRAADYHASDHFSDRATMAAVGKPPRPAGPDQSTEMAKARVRLSAVLAEGGKQHAPIEAANAQADFDCWVYRVATDAPADAVATCRDGFRTWLQSVEVRLSEVAQTEFRRKQLMQPRWWAVYFATDSTDLDKGGIQVVEDIVKDIRVYKDARIFVSGHTDLAGSREYNQKLSEKRASGVMATLVRGGVPREWIIPRAFGQERPVRLSTNIHDATNRRVDIAIEPLEVDPDKVEQN
jgi:OOP family OmpA-OmpF porin